MEALSRLKMVTALAALLSAACSAAGGGIEAITRPSQDVMLSFVRPGRVAKVLVKPGDSVKAGQALMRLDDSAEQAQVDTLKAQADDTIRVEAAKARLEQSKVDLQKIEWAAKRGAATDLEVRHAKLDVTIAELSLKLANFEHEQDQRKYQEAQLQLDRMKLKSPAAGKVEVVAVEEGECVDGLQEVIRIVSIDPLWIDVPVPLSQARTLKTGQPASVALPQAGPDASAEGEIIHVASVADAASDTLTVRVELPNPAVRPAGQRVTVSFPKPIGTGGESAKATGQSDTE